jgi:hypothetical protein
MTVNHFVSATPEKMERVACCGLDNRATLPLAIGGSASATSILAPIPRPRRNPKPLTGIEGSAFNVGAALLLPDLAAFQ